MCQTPPREWAWRGARLLGSKAGGEGPVVDPQLQGVAPPLSQAGAQQDRRWLWNEQWLSQAEGSHYSEVVSAPAPKPGQSPGLGVSPTPPSFPTAEAAPGRGTPALLHPAEACAKMGRHTQGGDLSVLRT